MQFSLLTTNLEKTQMIGSPSCPSMHFLFSSNFKSHHYVSKDSALSYLGYVDVNSGKERNCPIKMFTYIFESPLCLSDN